MTSFNSSSRPTKRRFWGKIFLFLAVIILVGFSGFQLIMKIKFADFQPPMAPANVIVTTVSPILFQDRIDAVGTAMANESATITATVTETVKSISIEEGTFVKTGDVIVELSDEEEQATLNEATRSYMRYNKLTKNNLGSAAQRDEELARMEVAKAHLNQRKILAPFDGLSGIREVSVGDLVTPGTVITTIDDITPIKLDFSVPETYMSALKNGLEVFAKSDAYPDIEFSGKIYAIDSRIDPETRSIRARAIIDNQEQQLRPGLLMKVGIVRSSHSSLAIPEAALMSSGDRHSVFVVIKGEEDSHSIAEKIVQIGIREPGYIEILSGLEDGDKVVVEGQMKTGAGAPVNIVEERNIEQTQAAALKFAIPRKQDAISPIDLSNKKEKTSE